MRPLDAAHFVPPEKNLPLAWLNELTARGTPRIYRGRELDAIGLPIGGIAAGQMYLCGDGALGSWQIFNRDYFSGYGANNYDYRAPARPVAQGFAVAVNVDGQRRVYALNRVDFAEVEFRNEYPIGRVSYSTPGCPVTVELEAFSPFIPLNADDSALPATILNIAVRNTSTGPVQAAVLGWLENAVGYHHAAELAALRRTQAGRDGEYTLIQHSLEAAPPLPAGQVRPPLVLADFEAAGYGTWQTVGEAFGSQPATGTAPQQNPVTGFQGSGLVNTYAGSDAPRGTLTSPPFTVSRTHVNFLVGGGGHAGQTCVNLVVDGRTVRTATGQNAEELRWHTWDVRDLAEQSAQIVIVDAHSGPWGHINVDQIELADEPRGGPGQPLDKLEDFGTLVLALKSSSGLVEVAPWKADTPPAAAIAHREAPTNITFPAAERGYGKIMTPFFELAPESGQTTTFVLAWHFPNFGETGQHYATRFADAAAVARYVLDNFPRLAGETRLWRDTFYDSTLPCWLMERIGSTFGNLATGTCRWWANGRFWAWEGVGCCHGTCTHVWNYAQTLAGLFPELERNVREGQDLAVALHADGLVGFRGEPNRACAADGQCGTVLKCYREHLMSADGAYLQRNWPRIRQVLGYCLELDGNDDGLIEGSQHNTYDINFEGANTFVGSLYLAALRAGAAMARIMGEPDFAQRLTTIAESGSRLTVERLFNGEYFIQQVDLARYPEWQYGPGCLSDQVFGQGWAHLAGLGYVYPAENIRQALAAVWRYNWAPDVGPHNAAHPPERWFARPGEPGLFTCTWPHSTYLDKGVRYREEVWTGIEYQVAGHMIWEGMTTEGLAIVRGVDDRYHPLRRNPFNEVECGDHYARALASWGVLRALGGVVYDGPAGLLGLAPRVQMENFRCAFTAAEGWGTLVQQRSGNIQENRVEIRWGRLRLRQLRLAQPPETRMAAIHVEVGGRKLPIRFDVDEGGVLNVWFEVDIVIDPQAPLVVTSDCPRR